MGCSKSLRFFHITLKKSVSTNPENRRLIILFFLKKIILNKMNAMLFCLTPNFQLPFEVFNLIYLCANMYLYVCHQFCKTLSTFCWCYIVIIGDKISAIVSSAIVTTAIGTTTITNSCYHTTPAIIQGISEKCTRAFKFWCRVIFWSIYLSKSCRMIAVVDDSSWSMIADVGDSSCSMIGSVAW